MKRQTLAGAKWADMPAGIDLQLATLRKSAPAGADWIYEIKLDGYRMLCRIDAGKCQLITRGLLNWTHRLSHLASDLLKLSVKSAWLDGEVVALQSDGISDFSTLQSAFRKGTTSQLTYSAFDVLYLDGYALGRVPSPSASGSWPRCCRNLRLVFNTSITSKTVALSFSSTAATWGWRGSSANERIAHTGPAGVMTGSRSNASGGKISLSAATSIRPLVATVLGV